MTTTLWRNAFSYHEAVAHVQVAVINKILGHKIKRFFSLIMNEFFSTIIKCAADSDNPSSELK